MDYYEILQIPKEASEFDIKKAYRKLAHVYHPDKQTGNAERFKEISEAYRILSDPAKRSHYDRFGSGDMDFSQLEATAGEDFAVSFVDKRDQQLVKISSLIEQVVKQCAAQNVSSITNELAKELANRVLDIVYGETTERT